MNNDKNKCDREKITFIQGFNDNDSKILSKKYPNTIIFSEPKKHNGVNIKNIYKNGFSYNKIQGINSDNIILDDNKISLGIDDHDLLNINKNLIIPRYFYTGAYNPFFKKYLTLNTEKLNHYNINNIEDFNNIDVFLNEETNDQNKLNENNYLIIESIDNYNKIIISKIDKSQPSLISYKKIDDNKFIESNEEIIILLDKYERLYINKVENVNITSSGKFNIFGDLNNNNENTEIIETNENAEDVSNSISTSESNGYEYVEIGGLKWATMNVGANSITDYGLYFQWGDTQGYTASQVGSDSGQKYFCWTDYKYCNGTSSVMTKYNDTDGKTVLDIEDDAVRANWGGAWRMPTNEEFNKLMDTTKVDRIWTSITEDNITVNGYLFTDKTNNNTLFFPVGGWYSDGEVYNDDSGGYYWSSSLDISYVSRAHNFGFNDDEINWSEVNDRDYGLAVRGVYDPQEYENDQSQEYENDQYYFESQNLSGLFKDSKVVDASKLILHNTLTESCYESMFKDCTELEKAPELPAKELVSNCYKEMFYGCNKLNYIKTQFKQGKNNENNLENLDGTNLPLYTLNWVKNVAETGTFINTFIKSNDWNIYNENDTIKDGILGVNGIPKLWVDDEGHPYDIDFGGPYIKQYLTIEKVSDEPVSIKLYITLSSELTSKIFYHKSKGTNWIELSATDTIELNDDDNKVYLKGNLNDSYEYYTLYHPNNNFGKINVYGNIMSLCNGDNFKNSYDEIRYDNCFKEFFSNLNIIDASNLILPATTLTDYCYANMFEGCKELIAAPELPATKLKQSCYESMFKGCENLKNASNLPTTTLANNCYKSMFEGCKNLKNAPILSATTLKNSCYESMFKGCNSLVNAPILPATNLSYEENGEIKTADNCYAHMFEGCTSLTTAPDLLATTLVQSCYESMFEGCTSLTSAPYLTINELNTNCFNSMFNGCTSLDYIKYKGPYKNDNEQFKNWLNGVAELGTFVNIKDDNGIITDSVNGIPEGWTKYDSSSEYLIIDPLELGKLSINKGTYVNSQQIDYLKNNKNIQYESDNDYLEINLTKRDILIIKSITEDLNTQLNNIINNENSLVHINSNIKFNLFGDLSSYNLINLNNLNYNLLSYLFINSLVIDASKLRLKEGTLNVNTDKYCYYKMFKGCTLLTNAPSLSAITLAQNCYDSMFMNCTSLTRAPELPAITLKNDCYKEMFYGCSKLNYIKALFEDIKENENYPYTLNWVKNVAINGQFIKSDNWNIDENNIIKDGILGVNGIPELWVDKQNNNYFIEYKNRYLTIERTSEDIVKLQWPKTATTSNHKTISYSFNSINWNEISSENLNIIELNNEHNKVYLKGNNTSYSNMTLHNIIENNSNISFKVYGNIMSLFYGDDFINKTEFPRNSTYNLTNFFKTTNVDDASNLILPVKTLTKCCYQYMFNNCSKLINIPELPATTLADNCYLGMFMDCTNIINVSKKLLPATILSKQCYWYMFKGCKSLENAPELPATTLATACYREMFEGCKSLETGPELSNKELSESCYQAMFKGCESLTSIIGELPGEIMKKSCYESMFEGCKSLENAPIIYATQITNRSFACMFKNCTNLSYIKYDGTWTNNSYTDDPTYTYATSYWNQVDQGPFYHWVDSVSETGKFINPNNLPFTSYATGYDNTVILYYIIPLGWEVINNQLYTNNTRAARLSSLTVDFGDTDNNDNNNLNTFSLLGNNIENYHKYTIVDENNYPAQAFIVIPDKWENELLIFKDDEENNYNIFNKSLFKPLKQNIILNDKCKYNVYVTQFTCNTITFKKSS